MTSVLVVGDVGVDVSALVPRMPEPDEKMHTDVGGVATGGLAANVAQALLQLGRPARLLARVGDDAAGGLAYESLTESGVDTSSVAVSPGIATYVTLIVIDATGEKRLILRRGESLTPSDEQLGEEQGDGADWVHLCPMSVTQAPVMGSLVRRIGVPWSVDLEPALLEEGGMTELACLLEGADTVFLNERAAARLGAEAGNSDSRVALAERMQRTGADQVIFTRGSRGAELHRAGHLFQYAPLEVRVVDTTGAGDVFAAGYIAARLEDKEAAVAARWAVTASGLACSALGATGHLPSRKEVEAKLARSEVT